MSIVFVVLIISLLVVLLVLTNWSKLKRCYAQLSFVLANFFLIKSANSGLDRSEKGIEKIAERICRLTDELYQAGMIDEARMREEKLRLDHIIDAARLGHWNYAYMLIENLPVFHEAINAAVVQNTKQQQSQTVSQQV